MSALHEMAFEAPDLNYYRRYCGDYAADTPHLSLLEHGAYTLMLDAYYTGEKPLPDSFDLLYRICRAQTAVERKAVISVATQFFPTNGEFRHNARADKELGIAVPKMAKLRETAHINGAKGGRPKKPREEPNPVPENIPDETRSGSEKEPDRKQPPTASLQPKAEKRFPDASSIPESAGVRGAAVLESLKALSLAEAKIPGGEDTPAAMLASVLRANGLRGNSFHPLVVEWAREGVTVAKLKDAITRARQRPGKDVGTFGPEYLDPILHDESKPAAQFHAEKASQSAAKNAEKAARQIAEQRAASEHTAPMPEALQRFARKPA